MARTWLVIVFIGVTSTSALAFDPKDYLWPLPQSVSCTGNVTIAVSLFEFKSSGPGGEMPGLLFGFERYRNIIFGPNKQSVSVNADQLDMLEVEVASNNDSLGLETNESYALDISSNGAMLKAQTVYGALRGLETFSQLVHRDEQSGEYLVAACSISDSPRFQYRGVLVDTSRHFVPMKVLLQHLDAMSYNKMNTFHWHIVDDQSFPYQSYTFPDLSGKGAYDQSHVYSQDDIATLIVHAKRLGIRVVPEFDSPGHTLAWGRGQPNLLTPCYSSSKPDGKYGPINPILDSTYTFLTSFFKEVADVFPDAYIHLGGDEVSFSCWESNPDIKQWMKNKNFTTNSEVEQYYEQTLIDIIGGLKKDYIVWQEVIDNGVKVNPNTVVSVWKGGYQKEMSKITAAGLKVILSSCWYLNYISYGKDWPKYYGCDPQDFNGTAAQKELVMGGSAAMWAEYVDSTNLISRMWPRASAVAERLWSAQSVTNVDDASVRLHNHRCRLITRGIPAEPIDGPGFFCPQEYVPE